MRRFFIKIIDFLFKIIFWNIEYYQIFPGKIKKAKLWIEKELNGVCKKEGINVLYKNTLGENNKYITLGTYEKRFKRITLLNNYYTFMKETTWLHEIGHHFLCKINSSHTEKDVDNFCLNIIKTFPKWVIQTMSIHLEAHFELSEENIQKLFDLSYFNIKLSEWR
jgi:hypothetical protein